MKSVYYVILMTACAVSYNYELFTNQIYGAIDKDSNNAVVEENVAIDTDTDSENESGYFWSAVPWFKEEVEPEIEDEIEHEFEEDIEKSFFEIFSDKSIAAGNVVLSPFVSAYSAFDWTSAAAEDENPPAAVSQHTIGYYLYRAFTTTIYHGVDKIEPVTHEEASSKVMTSLLNAYFIIFGLMMLMKIKQHGIWNCYSSIKDKCMLLKSCSVPNFFNRVEAGDA